MDVTRRLPAAAAAAAANSHWRCLLASTLTSAYFFSRSSRRARVMPPSSSVATCIHEASNKGRQLHVGEARRRQWGRRRGTVSRWLLLRPCPPCLPQRCMRVGGWGGAPCHLSAGMPAVPLLRCCCLLCRPRPPSHLHGQLAAGVEVGVVVLGLQGRVGAAGLREVGGGAGHNQPGGSPHRLAACQRGL